MEKKQKKEWEDLNVFEKVVGVVAVGFIIVAIAMGVSGAFDDKPKEVKKVDKQEQQEQENIKKNEKEKETTIKLDKKMEFAELTINTKDIKVYEKGGKNLAEVNFSWTNQSGDGKKYFFALISESVKQGEEVLEEVSGAYDMENKKTNSMHEHNPEGGTVNIKLIYELKDETTPLEITFSPLNEFNEEKQVISVDLD